MPAVVATDAGGAGAGPRPTTIRVPPWAAFLLVAAGLVLLGGRVPAVVYGGLVLVLLYLLLTHTGDVGNLVTNVVRGFGAPLEA